MKNDLQTKRISKEVKKAAGIQRGPIPLLHFCWLPFFSFLSIFFLQCDSEVMLMIFRIDLSFSECLNLRHLLWVWCYFMYMYKHIISKRIDIAVGACNKNKSYHRTALKQKKKKRIEHKEREKYAERWDCIIYTCGCHVITPTTTTKATSQELWTRLLNSILLSTSWFKVN